MMAAGVVSGSSSGVDAGGAFGSSAVSFIRVLLGLLLLLHALLSGACGHDSVPLSDAESERVLDSAELSVLRDPGRSLSIDDVSAPSSASQFNILKGGLALGFTTDVVWLRICIRRALSAGPEWWLDFKGPFADDVRLYSQRAGERGGWHESRAGDRYPMSARELPYRTIVFPVELPAEAPGVFYMRIETSSMMATAITAWTPKAFRAQAQKDLLMIGAMLGFVLAMGLANLANGLWTGQRLYLGFAAFTAVIFVVLVSGYGLLAQYFFPDSTWIPNAALNISFCVFLGGALLMARIPLRLAENFPRINRALPYVAAVMALAGFSTLFDAFVYVMPWVRAAQLLFSLLGAVAVIKNLRRGHANSGWILLAYACYALPMMISAFRALGFYPVNVNFEMMTPAVLAYSLLLHFGILTELREQNAKRLVAEENAEIHRKLASQEERLRAEQTTFFAFVAHELRSPLGILLTGLANLRRALPSPDNAARIVRLGQAAQRMSALIDRHLRLQNLARTDFEPDFADEPPDLPALEALHAQQQLHSARSFQCVYRGEAFQPVSLDAELVTLALSNLLDNAAKYAFEDSPIRLEVDVDEQSASVRYRVINEGPGLPPEWAGRAFQMFQRIMGTGSEKGGFGIGLALAAHVATIHGGQLTSAQNGTQTCFTLDIPIRQSGAASTRIQDEA